MDSNLFDNAIRRSCLFASLMMLTALISCGPQKDSAGNASVNELPQIKLAPEEGEIFSATDLPENTIIVLFNPDCDHCQREATDIHENMKLFKNYSFCFVSTAEFSEMRRYAENYGLAADSNVKFFQADWSRISEVFGDVSIPTIAVYGKDKKLIKRFDGETPATEIASAL